MIKTWETGPEGEFTCDNCGAVYAVQERRFPVRDKDTAQCQVCGETMAEWNSTYCPTFKLKQSPKTPRDASQLAKAIVDKATEED